jgi:L-seryl-tRNA(Ser) seleniumtransferase
MSHRLRAIPAVEKIVQALGDTDLPRPAVVAVVRRELAGLRKAKTIPDFDTVLARIRSSLLALCSSRLQPLINGTGILAHTNLGRAPLGPAVIEKLAAIGAHYNNLEYDLTGGGRGTRAAYLEHNLALLCGAEAATVVNNNAAALVLILRHFVTSGAAHDERGGRGPTTQGRAHPARLQQPSRPQRDEVIISRGELIQIGGGFRIPDILQASGARLREIGTTNKTSLTDYARAIGNQTALILKVHRSNFFMGGFVAGPATEEIAALARKKRIPFVEDLGSGAVIATEKLAGLEHEPTPAEVLRRGVDLVCFSGDKLLGGPQAGIIAGKTRLVAALKREPFFRALRCDKLILAGLEVTVDAYLMAGQAAAAAHAERTPAFSAPGGRAPRPRLQQGTRSQPPVIEMLTFCADDLRARAAKLAAALAGLPAAIATGPGTAQIGGGTLPRSVIESVALDILPRDMSVDELAGQLRAGTPPVIGYIERGRFKLDLRTVFPQQDETLARAIRAALER